jgi:hypothetical protein
MSIALSCALRSVRRLVPLRISGTPFEMATRLFPESHTTSYSYRSEGALNRLDSAGLAAARAAMRGSNREFNAARLRVANASNVDRATVNVAMALARKRMRANGGCGVVANASLCVGTWCDSVPNREWGSHYSKVPSMDE